jgi:hypothetical protein
MTGRKLGADPTNAMHGYVLFQDKKPTYAVVRVSEGPAPNRDGLGRLDKSRWYNGQDPWEPTVLLPLFDLKTREVYLLTSSNDGGRKAVATLVDAVVDNATSRPDDADKVPLCELESDSYVNTHNKRIFFPIFSILDWVERPDAILRIEPPPLPVLAIEDKSEASEPVEVELPPPRKRQRVAAAGGGGVRADMDDEIPFAPCR